MIEWLCRIIVLVFGLWLVGVSVLMMVKPHVAQRALSKFASTNVINYAELIIRFTVGAAFYGLSRFTAYSSTLKVVGVFLCATAIILMLIPREWHHRYAVWWAGKLAPWQVRLSAPFSAIAGIAAIWTAVLTLGPV